VVQISNAFRVEKKMKGQLTYVMKPLTLVSIIILLVLLLYSINTYKGRERIAEKTLDLTSMATNILLILANSEDCLAYRVPATQGAYANIVDSKKLDEFSEKYSEIEPDCARNHDFGWRVEVEEVSGESFSGGKTWSFGARDFSTGKAMRNKIEFWMPVAIRHSVSEVNVGRMSITLVDGELEKIAGFLDWSCKMGMLGKLSSSSTDVQINSPITYDRTNNYLCSGGGTKNCRKLLCTLYGFNNMTSRGTYSISTDFQSPDKLLVST